MSTQRTFEFLPPHTAGDALLSPIARRSDPGTSHDAAEAMTASGRREGQQLEILALVRRHPKKTSAELADLSPTLDRYQVARRLPELEHGGLVVKRNSRKCSITGYEAHTWEAL